jgi:hypothetical protein
LGIRYLNIYVHRITYNIKGRKMKMPITFEETNQTLKTSDLTDTCDLIPVIIWKEINLGATYRFVFRQAVEETDILVGVDGNSICVPYLDRDEFTARTITESTLDTSGYTKDKLSPKTILLEIGDIVYSATRISDVVQEDSPTLGWVRASLQKMGQAIALRIDTDIRDLLVVGAGNVAAAIVAGLLSYDDVIDAVASLKVNGYWAEDGTYLLFCNAAQEADLVKDTRFTDTSRYSMASIPLVGETGRYASCRCLVTDITMAWANGVAYALVVAPPTNKYGPAAMFAWKRHIKQETWRDEQEGRDIYLLSTRYGIEVKFDKAIALISNC